MELAYEAPTKHLKEFDTHNDYNFSLAHLATGEEYITHYRESTKYTICDNSGFELKHPLSPPEVIKAASLLKAQEVVAPDVFKSGYNTIKSTNEFIKYLEDSGNLGKFKVMAVVQGRNAPDWALCLLELQKNKHIDVLGMSYVGCESFDTDRANARIHAVRMTTLPSSKKKTIHLLGMGGNPIELVAQKQVPTVRSCDTSLPIVQGLFQNKFDSQSGLVGPKLARPANYFDVTMNKEQIGVSTHNFSLMKQWAS